VRVDNPSRDYTPPSKLSLKFFLSFEEEKEEEKSVNKKLTSLFRPEKKKKTFLTPEFISLLFTDLGVLTPAAVSDELIQLYT